MHERIQSAWSTILWLALAAAVSVAAVIPLGTVAWLQAQLGRADVLLSERKAANPTNFLIGQIAAAITAVLLFGFLAVLKCGRRDAAGCAFARRRADQPNWTRTASAVVLAGGWINWPRL